MNRTIIERAGRECQSERAAPRSRRPRGAVVFAIVCSLAGTVALAAVPLQGVPDIKPPALQVAGPYPPGNLVVRLNGMSAITERVFPALVNASHLLNQHVAKIPVYSNSATLVIANVSVGYAVVTELIGLNLTVPVGHDDWQANFLAADPQRVRLGSSFNFDNASLYVQFKITTHPTGNVPSNLPDPLNLLRFTHLNETFGIQIDGFHGDLDVRLKKDGNAVRVEEVERLTVALNKVSITDTGAVQEIADALLGPNTLFKLGGGQVHDVDEAVKRLANDLLRQYLDVDKAVADAANGALTGFDSQQFLNQEFSLGGTAAMFVTPTQVRLSSAPNWLVNEWAPGIDVKPDDKVPGLRPRGLATMTALQPIESAPANGDVQVFVPYTLIEHVLYELIQGGLLRDIVVPPATQGGVGNGFRMHVVPTESPRLQRDPNNPEQLMLDFAARMDDTPIASTTLTAAVRPRSDRPGAGEHAGRRDDRERNSRCKSVLADRVSAELGHLCRDHRCDAHQSNGSVAGGNGRDRPRTAPGAASERHHGGAAKSRAAADFTDAAIDRPAAAAETGEPSSATRTGLRDTPYAHHVLKAQMDAVAARFKKRLLAVASMWLLFSAAAGAKPSADDLMVVDCLLPGQIRQLARSTTYLSARRPVKTTAFDCRVRNGEYVVEDRASVSTALKVWLTTAEGGDPEAQTTVGEIFERGFGVAPDYQAAAVWYRRAAEAGHSRAQIDLGNLYEKGLGVVQDSKVALDWYRRAAGIDATIELDPTPDVATAIAAHDAMQADARAQMRAELERLATEVEAARAELAAAQTAQAAEAQHASEIDARAHAQTGTLESMIAARESELAAMRSELAAARAALNAEQIALDSARAAAAAQRDATEEANEATRTARVEAEQHRSELAATGERLAQRELALAQSTREAEALKARVQALEANAAVAARAIADATPRASDVAQGLLAGPEITLIDPVLPQTRGLVKVSVPATLERRSIVGRVTAPAGVLTVAVNDAPTIPNAAGMFMTELAMTKTEAPVSITAIDNQGKRADLAFVLAPASLPATAIAKPTKDPRPSDVEFGAYHALLIGNASYRYMPHLNTPGADVAELDDVLRTRFGFKTTVLHDANRYEILSALNELRGRSDEQRQPARLLRRSR